MKTAALLPILFLCSCMSHRQQMARDGIIDAVRSGQITTEQAQEWIGAIDPKNWWDDLVGLGGAILGGGLLGVPLTNVVRDRRRRMRQEPTGITKSEREGSNGNAH